MDIHSPRHREIFSHRIMPAARTIAAAAHKHALGSPSSIRATTLDYCSNMLTCLRPALRGSRSIQSPRRHWTCCSSCTPTTNERQHHHVRLAGSTGTNSYAAISAGVSALWGPAHGGANEAVLNMLEEIGRGRNNREDALVKDQGKSIRRLMGSAWRHKNFDPRAKIMPRGLPPGARKARPPRKTRCSNWRCASEGIALKDEYSSAQALSNVDFYSGLIYRHWHPALHVHGDVCDRPHRRLGGPTGWR